jgi:hypothetical protein
MRLAVPTNYVAPHSATYSKKVKRPAFSPTRHSALTATNTLAVLQRKPASHQSPATHVRGAFLSLATSFDRLLLAHITEGGK